MASVYFWQQMTEGGLIYHFIPYYLEYIEKSDMSNMAIRLLYVEATITDPR